MRKVSTAVALWCALLTANAPAQTADIHVGVASCATGVCHGKLMPQPDKHVWLNEYRVWSSEDGHARAYETLSTPASKQIAANLGIASAQTSPRCLNCHTDNVPQSQRGPKFQLSDGIACEACHGGAGRWIESHAEPTSTHADNLAKGMVATEKPLVRASLCIACHLGSEDRFATHEIMGAGHPRLSFELDAYTTNQPPHYSIDDDYRQRKGQIDGFNLWLAGQLITARQYVTLLPGHWFGGGQAIYPEFAFYDCHGCHHPMDTERSNRGGDGRPGGLRLQTDHLLILQATAAALDPDGAQTLASASQSLVRAGQHDAAAVRDACAPILQWIGAREDWAARAFDKTQVGEVRRKLIRYAAEGRMRDFAAAEQTFLSIESLSLYLGDEQQRHSALDRLFNSVEDDASFKPAEFASAARLMQDGM